MTDATETPRTWLLRAGRVRAGRVRAGRVVAGVVVALVVLVWWWWPWIARDPDRIDVAVVGTGEISQSDQAIQRRIREEGMSVAMVPVDPCVDVEGALDAVAAASPAVVVLSAQDADTCAVGLADLVDRMRSAAGDDPTVILAAQTGDADAVRAGAGESTVADPTRLLGPAEQRRATCMWWDDCEPDGQVEIRTATGELTPAGAERVARVIVGTVP